MIFNILALTSLFIVLALLKRIASIFPMIMSCLIRKKENISIDTSLKLRTERDLAATSMLLPFCLSASRFRLYEAGFMTGMSDNAILGITIGVFVCYILLRVATCATIRPKKMPSAIYHAAISTAHTYFFVLTLILIITGGLMTACGADLHTIKITMFWLSGAIYTLFLIRKMQIFSSYCNLFVSFLYLCALEILPTGVLIASAVIF